ncbi:MAG: carboxy-S-adenosyl-L-methionine synthase CmoA [Proteobacteria bacterium]|nr:carboxy-S-adenosyl-L-methionine synthase CmoA [Pseudomonadota bacterium]
MSNDTPQKDSQKGQRRDQLFAQKQLPGDFVFDENVAEVFEDMINRSVPGYSTIIAMIGVLAERHYQQDSVLYDLGCSLGGATFAMAHALSNANCSIVAVDNSTAMIETMQRKKASLDFIRIPIECRCEDVLDVNIVNASVVVLNFTLQFVTLTERQGLIERIYKGMNPGGILIISEKIVFPDEKLNDLFIDMYHSFKENMGYSKLEISQKRAALENVLLPETIDAHRNRLNQAGFGSFDVWFQCFNFASMVTFK